MAHINNRTKYRTKYRAKHKTKDKTKNTTKDNTKHKFKNCCHPGTKTPGIWQQFSVLKENI